MDSVGAYLAIGVAVCGGVLTANGFLALVTRTWRRTLGRYRTARAKVAKLVAGATSDYFVGVLGAPTTKRSVEDADGLVEWLWLDPLFVVQGIVDRDGTVARWAVTVRRGRLKLSFPLLPPGGEPRTKVTLTRTPFATVPVHAVDHVEAFHGARRFWYAERLYFGNPGRYQRFWLASNDGVTSRRWVSVEDAAAAHEAAGVDSNRWWETDPGRSAVAAYRDRATPNTYSEAVPGHDSDPYPIGPDRDHLRLVIR